MSAGELHQPDADVAATESTHNPRRSARGVPRWLANRILNMAWVLSVTVSMAVLTAMVYYEYRPDAQTDGATKQSVVTAAKADTIALLSYSPDTFDRDFAAAKTMLTGEFATYYGQFGEQVLRPAATQKGVKTSAVVPRAAVSELHPTSAVVLEYINQTTTTKEKPEPAAAASSVLVKLAKVDGRWLISSFDPMPV